MLWLLTAFTVGTGCNAIVIALLVTVAGEGQTALLVIWQVTWSPFVNEASM
jgi:hypothetical protein